MIGKVFPLPIKRRDRQNASFPFLLTEAPIFRRRGKISLAIGYLGSGWKTRTGHLTFEAQTSGPLKNVSNTIILPAKYSQPWHFITKRLPELILSSIGGPLSKRHPNINPVSGCNRNRLFVKLLRNGNAGHDHHQYPSPNATAPNPDLQN